MPDLGVLESLLGVYRTDAGRMNVSFFFIFEGSVELPLNPLASWRQHITYKHSSNIVQLHILCACLNRWISVAQSFLVRQNNRSTIVVQ